MDPSQFLNLPVEAVADLVRGAGPKVAVFPINGTRRWFRLEHAAEAASGGREAYFRIAGRRHVELYRLFFDHGVDTLLTPVFGSELLKRGDEYNRAIVPDGLLWLAQNPEFLAFYDEYEVRVRVYGETRRFFTGTPHAHVLDVFDELAERTKRHNRFRLFLGVCANTAAESVAEFAVRHAGAHGTPPTFRQIVEAYYGEFVPPVNLFIGFQPPAAFDMPLLALGEEDLYFTVSPSPYLDAATLRSILYDHLYARRVSEEYDDLDPAGWQALADLYRLNRRNVMGVGRKHASGGFWYPVPQLELPSALESEASEAGAA